MRCRGRMEAVMAELHLAFIGLLGLGLEVLDFSLDALQFVQEKVKGRKL